jgi:hypothetical protein
MTPQVRLQNAVRAVGRMGPRRRHGGALRPRVRRARVGARFCRGGLGRWPGAHTGTALAQRRRRQNAVVLTSATALGLWLGVAAPGCFARGAGVHDNRCGVRGPGRPR